MSASDAAAKSSSQTASVKIVIPKAKVKSGGSDVVDLTSDVSATIANPDDEATLSKFNLIHVSFCTINPIAEKLKKTWRSPIYALFKIDQVSVEYHNGRLAHFFPCGARKCKFAAGGIRRYQDTLDKSSTANLKQHAVSCWGQEAVDAVIGGDKAKERSGSVFAAFARKGQQPAHHTHHVHTNNDIR